MPYTQSYIQYSDYFNLTHILRDIEAYLPDFNEHLFMKAFSFAEAAHRGQTRKDGATPYIAHPIEIVKILTLLHADQDVLIGALLHDVPEDTSHTLSEIRELFGDSIAFLVDGTTKLSHVQYTHNMPERQVESLKKMFLHTAKDLRVILIKLADRLHNMRTLENIEKPEKRIRIARETIEIYVPIANLLGIHAIKQELEEHCFKHLFPIEYDALKKKTTLCDAEHTALGEHFIKEIRMIYAHHRLHTIVDHKRRSLYSLYKKLCADGKSIDDLACSMEFCVIAENISECYQVMGLLHGKYVPKPGTFKDYIAHPKPNGYQSLHTTVFGPKGLTAEVHIRTQLMHLNAEFGVAAHFFDQSTLDRKGHTLLYDKRSSWVNKVLELNQSHQVHDFETFLNDLKFDLFQDRIVVFTPKGDPIDLPQGASVLDLAYAIHSDIGTHAVKAEINGHMYPLNHPLSTGDVVQIVTSAETAPDLSWLSFVKTNLAKNRIRAFFKRLSRKEKLLKGKRILQKEFDIAGLGLIEGISFKKVRVILRQEMRKDFRTLHSLFIAVAEGQVQAGRVAKILQGHRRKLVNFLDLLTFRKNSQDHLIYNVKVLAKNRLGLVPEITRAFYHHALDMTYFKGYTSRSQKNAIFNIQIAVDDMSKISRIFDELQQIEGVRTVYRISYSSLVLFSVLAGITMVAWILHPVLINYLSTSGLLAGHPILHNYIVNIALLVLLGMVLYLTTLAQRYFPLLRHRAAFVVISLSIGVLAMITLLVEIFYYHLELNWIALFLEMALIYGYLGMNYLHLRQSHP